MYWGVKLEESPMEVDECNEFHNKYRLENKMYGRLLYERSPRSLRASARSLGWIVTRLA
jgi:hypothetical protein